MVAVSTTDSTPALAMVERLRSVLTAVSAIQVSTFESLSGPELLPLVEDTHACLRKCIEGVTSAQQYYDALIESRTPLRAVDTASDPHGGLCGEVERVMDSDRGVSRVANLAFIGRFGLRARVESIATLSLESTPKWEIIATVGGALREAMKALGALDIAICEAEGLPEPKSFYITELERSLAVRRAYRVFFEDIAPRREPAPGEVHARLRRVGISIGKLVGRPIYAAMRIHDRHMLRQVQHRVIAWLGSSPQDASAETNGLRVWEDVAHLAEMMMRVNERAELRAHDERTLRGVAEDLPRGALCGADLATRLRPCWGRDADLDRVIEGGSLDDDALGVVLARVIAVLAPRTGLSETPRPSPASLPDNDSF